MSVKIFTILLFLVMALPAYAEMESPAPAVLNVDFESIEGIGLYSKTSEGGLGKSLWKNSKRSSITALLKNMPANSETPEVNAMIFGILLTKTNPKLIENDIPPENGNDLLTLRLEKLIEAGAYQQAFEIYSQLDTEAYHERLARSGVMAMLYSGEKSLACLETNIVYKRFKDISFWKTLSAYCDISLSEKPNPESLNILGDFSKSRVLKNLSTNKNYSFIYTNKAYSRLKALERALIAAEEKLDVSKIKNAAIKKMPAAHVQPILRLKKLSGHKQTILSIRAVQLGLNARSTLEKLYTAEEPQKPDEEIKDWKQLSALYNIAKNEADKTLQWQILRKSFPLAQKFGSIALTPYAPLIQRASPADPSLDEILAAYQILHHAGLNISDRWINAYKKIEFDEEQAEKYAQIIAVSAILRPQQKKIKESYKKIFAVLQVKNQRKLLLLQGILDKLDNKAVSDYTQSNIYEKDFYLTAREDYVMQSGVVWDRLVNTSHNKAIGETILLNVILLHEQNLQDIYPGLLGDILQSTENVGLTRISKNLAIKASLGNT